jgi:hypothetical protein
LDKQFQKWLERYLQSGIELRILCENHLDAGAWAGIKRDVKNILDRQMSGTAKDYRTEGNWNIVLRDISQEYHPLSTRHISSVVFCCARAHKNEQNKFIEDIRKGCSNLVKHTRNKADTACPVLLVRLCKSASIKNCGNWAHDYFTQFPNERVGLIILYQAAVVNSEDRTSLAHYILPIMGPQFEPWAHPPGLPARKLPNMAILVGVRLDDASRKVIQTDGHQIALDDTYSYQRGDIYRFYRLESDGLQPHLSNPAPGIKIHAEIEKDGQSTVLQKIWSEKSELHLLP